MKKLSLIIFAVAITLAQPSFADENSMVKKNIKSIYEFSFIPKGNTDDVPMSAVLIGNDCNNLKGKIMNSRMQVIFEGYFSCFPNFNFQKDIKNLKIKFIDNYGTVISFLDGPALLALGPAPKSKAEFMRDDFAPWAANFEGLEDLQRLKKMVANIPQAAFYIGNASIGYSYKKNNYVFGEFFEVVKIEDECPMNIKDANFCVKINNYNFSSPHIADIYAVYCWDCGNAASSPFEFTKRIIAQSGNDNLILRGGYATPVRSINGFNYFLKDRLSYSNQGDAHGK